MLMIFIWIFFQIRKKYLKQKIILFELNTYIICFNNRNLYQNYTHKTKIFILFGIFKISFNELNKTNISKCS
jgi:hypothetical protein